MINTCLEGKKILLKTFDLKRIDGRYTSEKISEEEFEIAKKQGYMFPRRRTLEHDECMERLESVLKQISPEDVANAFLYSLTTRALEYRSALGSYWYAVSIPKHRCVTGSSCDVCGWELFNNLKTSETKNHVNLLNYE